MNKQQEKLLWWCLTLGSYALSFYILYCILSGTLNGGQVLIQTFGMSLICYFTTSCLISIYDYENEANTNNDNFKKDPHRGE